MIAILDYGAGNLTSVQLALEHLGAKAIVAQNYESAMQAERVIFPGVGSAESGLAGLRKHGLDQVIADCAKQKKPLLAVCLGMQMLFDYSFEDNGVDSLGLMPGKVRKFDFSDSSVKVPHMGWNTVEFTCNHPVLKDILSGSAFYFVHSYYADAECQTDIAGTTEYENFRFTSIAARGTIFATQFHPERSGKTGLKLIKNFLNWEPEKCC